MREWLRNAPWWFQALMMGVWTGGWFTAAERAPVVGSLLGGTRHPWWYDWAQVTGFWCLVWLVTLGLRTWMERRKRRGMAQQPSS